MSDRCGGTPVKSTLWNALNKPGTLSKLKIAPPVHQPAWPGRTARYRLAGASQL
jgi:hypothetical protein